MLSIAKDKIDSLFELIGSSQPLYLPVDTSKGTSDFQKWEKGAKTLFSFEDRSLRKGFLLPKDGAHGFIPDERKGSHSHRPTQRG